MDESFCRKRALVLWKEAQAVHLTGNIERAIELYTSSIELHPTSEAHTFLGWAYSFQGRIDDAIAECERAIAVDPTFGNPYNDIGSYLIRQGAMDEAIPWVEKAKAAPRYEARHFPFVNLGRVYAAKGWVLRAIHEFEEALVLRPGDENCIKALQNLRRVLQ